jgi:hypothetical protein
MLPAHFFGVPSLGKIGLFAVTAVQGVDSCTYPRLSLARPHV